jgi:hypothetical protein
MKILELINILEEAYDRFGDIPVMIDNYCKNIRDVSVESEEVIIISEKVKNYDVA